jgi:hypothetical protein
MAVKPGNGGNGERDPRLDLLYRDAAREAPPARLDAAIRAAARREVGARPRAFSSPLRRWRVPVSIAAIVILSVSLVTLVSEEGGESLLRDERLPAAPPLARKLESPQQPPGPAQAPEARKRAAVSAPEESSLRRDEAAAVAEAEPRRRAAERQQAPSSAAPAARPDTGAPPPAAAVGGVFSYLQESPPRAEADAAQKAAPSIGVRGGAADTAPSATAPQPKPFVDSGRIQAEQALAMKRPPVWQGLEQEPPQKWLERLAELKRQGRTGEASELLAELKRRFPDYPLPSGLE